MFYSSLLLLLLFLPWFAVFLLFPLATFALVLELRKKLGTLRIGDGKVRKRTVLLVAISSQRKNVAERLARLCEVGSGTAGLLGDASRRKREWNAAWDVSPCGNAKI